MILIMLSSRPLLLRSREPKTDLLHGVCGHDTEDHRNAAVQRRVEHSASGTAHNRVKVRRRTSHLSAPIPLQLFTICISWLHHFVERCSESKHGMRSQKHAAACSEEPRPLTIRGRTTAPTVMTASYFPLFAMALAISGSSKLPGTQATCRHMCARVYASPSTTSSDWPPH